MNNKYRILIPLMISGAMGTVDSSVLNVAMPTLANVFKVEMQTVSWISSSYLLVLTSLLLTAGRLGDIYGYKKPFEWGLIIFTTGTALCGLAPTLFLLIIARAFQAVGTSLFMAAAPAMIASYFPPEERGKAMSLNIVSISVGLILGPSFGGLILSKFIWRYIFFINIPLGIIAFLAAKTFIPTEIDKKEGSLDSLGTILALVFLASLLFYINRGSSIGWLSNIGLTLVTTSVLTFIAFILHERKALEPMLDLSLFSSKAFTAGLASNYLYFIAQVVMVFLVPFLLTAANYPPGAIGLIATAFPFAMMIFAPIGGYLADRINPNHVSALGGIFVVFSMLLLGTLQPSFSFKDVVLRMLIFGIGGGLFETSNAVIVLGSAPKHRWGIASGVLAMVRNAGMVFGIAISSALTGLRQEYHLKGLSSLADQAHDIAAIRGIKDIFLLASACALVCVVISIMGASSTKVKKEIVN